jgi:hypothetical protein
MQDDSGKYSNFRDPFGLVRRMLRSGDRAAYTALCLAGMELGLAPLDLALRSYEKRLHQRSAAYSDLPILLVVGAPRSGSTLVYQALVSGLDVSYFSNLGSLFPRAPIAASLLFGGAPRTRPKPFRSYYGNTAGLSGPSDAFSIWNRWLGATDRYHAPASIDEEQSRSMREFFDTWLSTFGRPLVNKNNRNTDCLALLAAALPNARFVVVRREPEYVAQSLVLAREQIQGSRFVGWGLLSQDSNPDAGREGYLDDVCRQVFAIEARLREGEAQVDARRFLNVAYESFCEDPVGAVRRISRTLLDGAVNETALAQIGPFKVANRERLDPEEMTRMRGSLRELFQTL